MRIVKCFLHDPYKSYLAWPEDCFLQSGKSGLVLKDSITTMMNSDNPLADLVDPNKIAYTTAYFEAFPKDATENGQSIFIRGEGATVEEAEKQAWEKYLKYKACSGHTFEARGYTNGAGFCVKCDMFQSDVIAPVNPCVICGTLTWHSTDKDGDYWCSSCYPEMPDDKMHDYQLRMKEWRA